MEERIDPDEFRLLPPETDGVTVTGRMKGSAEILGDVVAPTGERWDADE